MARTFLIRGAAIAAAAVVAIGMSGCTPDDQDDATPAPSSAGADAAQPSSSPTDQPGDQASASGPDIDLRETQLPVSAEDALSTASDAVGAGFVYGIELDYDERDAAWEWEVDILDGTSDHEIEIDATTGEIIGQKSDSTNDKEEPIDLNDPMTYDEALELATAEVDGPLRGWKLEWDDGKREYQFDFMRGDDEVEVTVDVESGQVRTD